MKSLFYIFLLALCGALTATAQTTGDTSVPKDASLTTKQPDNTSNPARSFFGESLAGHWTFSADTSFDQEYDDNVFNTGLLRLSDNVSRISARFTMAVQKKRLRVQFHYFPDYVAYAKYSDRNALSHQLAQEIDYRFSGRTEMNWNLIASRAPSNTNSPFGLVNFDGVFLPVFHPEALQSDALITNASTSVTLSHRFSAKNTVSISGQGSIVKFQVTNGVPLSPFVAQESFSNGLTVKWENEFIPRHKLGIELGEQYFGFLSPASHSHYQFIKARYSQSFGRDYTISLGAGPSRRERQTSGVFGGGQADSLDYAFDASLTKSTQRQSLGITYSHGTQLGLSQGSLGSDSLSFSASRSLGRRWRVNGGFGFSRSQSETIFVQSISRSYSASATAEYQLRPDLSLTGGYSYVNQDVEQNLPGAIPFDRNVYRLGIRYTFQRVTSR